MILDVVSSFSRCLPVWCASGSVVGLYADRCAQTVLAMHAIARSGMGLMPLDSSLNLAVVGFRIAAAGSFVTLCDTQRACLLRKGICVSMIERHSSSFSVVQADSHGFAYVLFTSGSTGTPKGVCMAQRETANYFMWIDRCSDFVLTESDSFLMQASVSFDIMLTMVFWAKLVSVVLQNGERDGHSLVRQIERDGTALLYLVPSHFMALSAAVQPKSFSKVRVIMFAGEALSVHVAQLCRTKFSWIDIWNLYGPTETNVVTSFSCSQEVFYRFGTVPIGRPLPNCATRLMEDLKLMLCGTSVGRGYMGLAERTRERFLYDPHHNDGEQRMYDSGDQARFVAETGDVEYLGRRDDQVKINGQRVELGAVESAVLGCAGVRQCAVVVMEGRGDNNDNMQSSNKNNKWLAAFVVGATSGSEVKRELGGKVARHEMPHRVLILDSIPLTSSGKADRFALKRLLETSLQDVSSRGGVSLSASSSSLHMAGNLRAILEEVLGVAVGPGESIWDRGATSLTALRVQAELLRRTGSHLTMDLLLKDGSVEGIANHIAVVQEVKEEQSLPSSHAEGFVNVRRFGGTASVVLFCCSYGWLASTGAAFIGPLTARGCGVLVLEFSGLDMSPRDISMALRSMLSDDEMLSCRAVVGFSGGGVCALEMVKVLASMSQVVVLLDCSVPPFDFDFDHVLHACVEPFALMAGLPSIRELPRQLLPPLFAGILRGFVADVREADRILSSYVSPSHEKMLRRYNEWRWKGEALDVDWIFISAHESELNWKLWSSCFGRPPSSTHCTKGIHGEMLAESADIVLSMLFNK